MFPRAMVTWKLLIGGQMRQEAVCVHLALAAAVFMFC